MFNETGGSKKFPVFLFKAAQAVLFSNLTLLANHAA
jgi:hypothetical protein